MRAARFSAAARQHYFDASGQPHQVGHVLKNPELAVTLERIAEEGAEAFYSGTIAPMLKFYCTGCHSGSNPQGNLDLMTYANVKEVVDDNSLLGTIEWKNGFNKMPKNGSKLTNCNILKIKKWIAVGAPNN